MVPQNVRTRYIESGSQVEHFFRTYKKLKKFAATALTFLLPGFYLALVQNALRPKLLLTLSGLLSLGITQAFVGW